MNVVLVDSGGANIGSVRHAFARLGVDAVLSADAEAIGRADRVVLPGVGSAAPAMARLRALGLVDVIRGLQQPLLGICLGMQLLFESSEEGEGDCLGLLPGRVRKLVAVPGVRVPHMGWNGLLPRIAHPLLSGIDAGAQAYFVHSYAAPMGENVLAACSHGSEFAAVVGLGNRFGAQFHPERSADVGSRLLANFLSGSFS